MQLYSLLLHKILWTKWNTIFYRSDQIWWKDNGDREKKQEGPEKESKTTLYFKKVRETGLQKQWIKTFN